MKLVGTTKIQLLIFAIVTVLSVGYAAWSYGGLQRATGIGTYEVQAEFANSGGLYPRAIVTYRGSDVGVVTAIDVAPGGAVATLRLKSHYQIPADLTASILSVSAIGEQYVDLVPRSSGGPKLANGDRIGLDRTTTPTSINALMRNATDLIQSVPDDQLRALVDESHRAFAGTGESIAMLIAASRDFIRLAQGSLGQTLTLINRGEPVLDSVNATAASITRYTRDLASFTDQLTLSDGQIRVLLDRGPAFADTMSDLFEDNSDTLPLLLRDLQAVGQVLKVYVPGIRQILVVYPAMASSVNAAARPYQHDDDLLKAQAGLDVKLGNTLIPPSCTNGYQGTQRRDPSVTSNGPSAYGARCVLPHNDPRAVRGSRNLPCMTNTAVRTALVKDCPGGLPSTWPRAQSPDYWLSSTGPTRRPRVAGAAYDRASGRVVMADGTAIIVSGVVRSARGTPTDLESLLLGGTRE